LASVAREPIVFIEKGTVAMSTLKVFTLGPCCLLCMFALPQASFADDNAWTLEDAMRTVENDKAEYSRRVTAITFLKEHKAKAFIPRLGNVLQGKYDVVALEILIVFASFADRCASPYIQAYKKRAIDDQIWVPGKINVAWDLANTACMPKK
jgi:hypothetical protein